MQYRVYGRTGKKVSVVGFGAMRFDISRPKEENADLVRHAAARGITYFDTAPNYCGDQSEDIFGLAFKDMPGPFYVSTKGMPTTCTSATLARDAVRRSLDRLGVPRIHFYHVWCVRKLEHYELAMRPGGQYEGLLRCREEGLIDHIAISTHLAGNEVRQVLAKGEFEGVLMGINLLNARFRWEGIRAAQERGCGVVAMNPLAGGAIPQHERELAFLAGPGETPTEAALRYVIGCPEITVTLVGFTTKAHVDLACRVADQATPLSPADVARIQSRLTDNVDAICTGCGYCKDCPQHLPVPSYMQFYNEKLVFGKSDADMIKELPGQHGWGFLVERPAAAGECTDCGKCEKACTQHLPIRERLKEITAWEAQQK